MFYGISMFYDHPISYMDDRMQRNGGYRAVAQDSLCQGAMLALQAYVVEMRMEGNDGT